MYIFVFRRYEFTERVDSSSAVLSCLEVSDSFNCGFLLTFPDANVKGKAIPLQAWTDPEGSRRLRLPDFKTIDI